MASADDAVLLSICDLRVHLLSRRGIGKAIDGVNIEVRAGEVLGLVGESGSGKSMTALAIMGLLPKSARVVDGEVRFKGRNLLQLEPEEMRKYRGKHIGMILQDPMTALNPVFRIGNQLEEPLRIHLGLAGVRLRDRCLELLRLMQIKAPSQRLRSFAHQLSGGMRQRVVGAIALSCDPALVIADEPTTSLDVTVQAAYIELLQDIRKRTNVGMLFITHDFGIVDLLCDRVSVMYAGKIVETAPTTELLERPAHPYAEALIASVPRIESTTDRLPSIAGHPPSPYAVPPGCPFSPRCRYVMPRCSKESPPEVEVTPGHTTTCWKYV